MSLAKSLKYNQIDLHTHSIVSGHAYSTIAENIEIAKERQLKILGLSEHAPSMPGSTHPYYFSNMRVLPNKIEDLIVLKGAELNVLNDKGDVDLDAFTLDFLDYAIISLHMPCYEDLGKERNTDALIHAMKHPKVLIVGHPDDDRLPVNYERLVKAAKEHHILIEVNNSSLSPQAFRVNARENYEELLKYCEAYACDVIINSDSHFYEDIGNWSYAIELLDSLHFPKERIVNFDLDRLMTYVKGCNRR